MPLKKDEIDAFHARKVALITGISGQVKWEIIYLYVNSGWLLFGGTFVVQRIQSTRSD
jgi:hypothetical protein